jgi:hypothetical protein
MVRHSLPLTHSLTHSPPELVLKLHQMRLYVKEDKAMFDEEDNEHPHPLSDAVIELRQTGGYVQETTET